MAFDTSGCRYLSEPVLDGHPVLSGHYSPEGVRLIQVSLYMLSFFPILVGLQHKPLTRADTVGSLPKIEFKT